MVRILWDKAEAFVCYLGNIESILKLSAHTNSSGLTALLYLKTLEVTAALKARVALLRVWIQLTIIVSSISENCSRSNAKVANTIILIWR